MLGSSHSVKRYSRTLVPQNSYGGRPFASLLFKQFLEDLTVKHRLSSVAYLQSNGWTELAVETAKRIVNGNTGSQGSLDNGQAVRTILKYRNTPIHNIGLSPAQFLLYCWLRDFVPSQPVLYKPHEKPHPNMRNLKNFLKFQKWLDDQCISTPTSRTLSFCSCITKTKNAQTSIYTSTQKHASTNFWHL